jgi:hypothetical protein
MPHFRKVNESTIGVYKDEDPNGFQLGMITNGIFYPACNTALTLELMRDIVREIKPKKVDLRQQTKAEDLQAAKNWWIKLKFTEANKLMLKYFPTDAMEFVLDDMILQMWYKELQAGDEKIAATGGGIINQMFDIKDKVVVIPGNLDAGEDELYVEAKKKAQELLEELELPLQEANIKYLADFIYSDGVKTEDDLQNIKYPEQDDEPE